MGKKIIINGADFSQNYVAKKLTESTWKVFNESLFTVNGLMRDNGTIDGGQNSYKTTSLIPIGFINRLRGGCFPGSGFATLNLYDDSGVFKFAYSFGGFDNIGFNDADPTNYNLLGQNGGNLILPTLAATHGATQIRMSYNSSNDDYLLGYTEFE